MTDWLAYAFTTVISFLVNVPVLSEQMMVTSPKLSAAGSFFMIIFFFASCFAPMESEMVTIAGRLLGMAATARLNANIRSGPETSLIANAGSLVAMLSANTNKMMTMTAYPIC